MRGAVDLVLFDLDGTLIDSAPDLAEAANELRRAHGLPALPHERLRPVASSGARGMIGVAFGIGPGDDGYEPLRTAFLERYEARMLRLTQVFEAVLPMLDALESQGLRWGVVTNKAMRFAGPITLALGLHERAAVVIGGDSTPHLKPHPAPLHEAARRAGVPASRAIYIGDDRRDIAAGAAAGMATAAAAWGYLGAGESVDSWGADAILDHPNDLLQWLGLP